MFKEDIETAFPWPSSTYKVDISGEKLMKVLEHSIHDRINATKFKHGGAFLQYSGIQV